VQVSLAVFLVVLGEAASKMSFRISLAAVVAATHLAVLSDLSLVPTYP
jgi:hypothetical protein